LRKKERPEGLGPPPKIQVPEIDIALKLFREQNRFSIMEQEGRNYGKKYIPPPKCETVKQLLDD
jgi:hypothetical protein